MCHATTAALISNSMAPLCPWRLIFLESVVHKVDPSGQDGAGQNALCLCMSQPLPGACPRDAAPGSYSSAICPGILYS